MLERRRGEPRRVGVILECARGDPLTRARAAAAWPRYFRPNSSGPENGTKHG
jgi:hypothetical protein